MKSGQGQVCEELLLFLILFGRLFYLENQISFVLYVLFLHWLVLNPDNHHVGQL